MDIYNAYMTGYGYNSTIGIFTRDPGYVIICYYSVGNSVICFIKKNNIIISEGNNIRVEGTINNQITRVDLAVIQCDIRDIVML